MARQRTFLFYPLIYWTIKFFMARRHLTRSGVVSIGNGMGDSSCQVLLTPHRGKTRLPTRPTIRGRRRHGGISCIISSHQYCTVMHTAHKVRPQLKRVDLFPLGQYKRGTFIRFFDITVATKG